MLRRFSVTNFKNFKEKLTFDLGSPSNYAFNAEVIDAGIKSKGIIYGTNGSGKSNLTLALFDIVLHVTDKERILSKYYPYLNLDSQNKHAEFEYVFDFFGNEVVYRYRKTAPMELVSEEYLFAAMRFCDTISRKGRALSFWRELKPYSCLLTYPRKLIVFRELNM